MHNSQKPEEAQALGFNSIKEAESHQQWLDKRAQDQAQISQAVAHANENGTSFLDIRHVDLQSTANISK